MNRVARLTDHLARGLKVEIVGALKCAVARSGERRTGDFWREKVGLAVKVVVHMNARAKSDLNMT